MDIISLSSVKKISWFKSFDFIKEKEIVNVLVYPRSSVLCTEMCDIIDYEFGLMTDHRSVLSESNIVMIYGVEKN